MDLLDALLGQDAAHVLLGGSLPGYLYQTQMRCTCCPVHSNRLQGFDAHAIAYLRSSMEAAAKEADALETRRCALDYAMRKWKVLG